MWYEKDLPEKEKNVTKWKNADTLSDTSDFRAILNVVMILFALCQGLMFTVQNVNLVG